MALNFSLFFQSKWDGYFLFYCRQYLDRFPNGGWGEGGLRRSKNMAVALGREKVSFHSRQSNLLLVDTLKRSVQFYGLGT